MAQIIWKYVKPLKNEKSIELFLINNSIELPQEIIDCIQENNGGRPSPNAFDTDKTNERVFKALLSYNIEDKENIYNVYNNEFKKKEMFPIASDESGNFICVDLKSNYEIVLLDHETGKIEFMGDKFFEVLKHLY